MAGKSNLTQERVSAAAGELRAAGVEWPSAADIREHLKRTNPPGQRTVGGQGEIQGYLKVWRLQMNGKPTDLSQAKIPGHLNSAIQSALHAIEQEVRNECAQMLEGAEKEATDLLSVVQGLESELDDLRNDLAQKVTERDELAGKNRFIASELVDHKKLLSSSLEAQSRLQIEIAELRIREASLQEFRQESKSREDDLRNQLRQVSDELSDERNGRLDAQRHVEHLQRQVCATEQALDAADLRFNAVLSQIQQVEPATVRAAVAEARILDLEAQLETLSSVVGKNPRSLKRLLLRSRQGSQSSNQSETAQLRS